VPVWFGYDYRIDCACGDHTGDDDADDHPGHDNRADYTAHDDSADHARDDSAADHDSPDHGSPDHGSPDHGAHDGCDSHPVGLHECHRQAAARADRCRGHRRLFHD
jgi:hypothetical protein